MIMSTRGHECNSYSFLLTFNPNSRFEILYLTFRKNEVTDALSYLHEAESHPPQFATCLDSLPTQSSFFDAGQ
jgi:hypothetical protein